MKRNKTTIFIAVSSMALLIVLIIQVNWIFQTAKIKEEFFNEKANMVLSRTTEALGSDKEACQKIGDYLDETGKIISNTKIESNEVHKIDSLFNHYMKFYNFHIDYSFAVLKPTPFNPMNGIGFKNHTYNKCVDEINNDKGIELKLIFPDKKKYIFAEMGTMFITSVLLIIIVLILFWKTTHSLLKEKRISEHTNDFLNNMTHEFKTPLTNIALAGKMMVKDSLIQKEDKLKHYTEIILDENEKLRLQVEQVLNMTAFERGEIPLRKTEFDFHTLIADSLKCISLQLENKNIDLQLKLNAGNTIIIADKTHLGNAICNLIDNAIKYAKENPQLIIETFNVNKNLLIKISDNGIGIDKEYHKKVFEKFFRVPTGDLHDVKGFGLGLAYVKKIIELHGGTIEMQSEKEKGTEFIISIANAEGQV